MKKRETQLSHCCGQPLKTECGLQRCPKCGHTHGQSSPSDSEISYADTGFFGKQPSGSRRKAHRYDDEIA